MHRKGTKRELLLDLLRRDEGGQIEALSDALGWQPHTVRAAITRLRQDGVAIIRVPGQDGSLYCIGVDVASYAPVGIGADA